MATESPLLNLKFTPRSVLHGIRLRGWDTKSCGAVLGLCGGIIAPVFGSILTAISWFTGSVWDGWHMQRDGTILLFLTIPLLILGAHCLDLIDKEGHSKRIALSNQKGNGNDLGRDKERS